MDDLENQNNTTDNFLVSDCQDKTIKLVHYAEYGFIFFIAIVAIFLYIKIALFCPVLSHFVLLALVIIFGIFPLYISYITRRLIQKYPHFNSQKPHHAIIIAHDTNPKSGIFTYRDYLSGIDLLISRFRCEKKEINYKIYEINKKDLVIPIVMDENTTHLWLFGHGTRNKLKFFGETLCYYDLRDAPKKIFIGQYHCNSILGKSLADYNRPLYQDVTHFARMDPFIRISVLRKLKELDENNLLENKM